jgi:hypothetical protein
MVVGRVVKSKFVKTCLSQNRIQCGCVITTTSLAKKKTTYVNSTLSHVFFTLATMVQTSKAIPQRQIETRPSNKLAHPGKISKPASCQSSAEVQQEHDAKAKAKADREEAERQSIARTAKFEQADIANENIVDTTPHPHFSPKPWPPPCNRKGAKVVPIAELDDTEISHESDNIPLTPAPSEQSVTEGESTTEDDESPPAKKKRVYATKKPTGVKPAGEKIVEKKKADGNEDIATESDEEKTPKPKKVKVKVRDEIDIAAKKMGGNVEGNFPSTFRYRKMAELLSHAQVKGQAGGEPAPKAPLQAQATQPVDGKLKREGAISDIKAIDKASHAVQTQTSRHDLMDVDKTNRY